MKFSACWLRQWLPVDVPVTRMCEQLTNAGLEVDGVEAVAPAFSGVVVADVCAVRRHPNADKLSVCEVDAGGRESALVVCGAPNARAGLRTALATVGAKLPGGAVRAAKLRGVVSHGMLCSAAELGLGTDHAGILELDGALFERTPHQPAPGTDLRDALHLDDACVNVDLTPNRGDCLSIRGLARELALLNDVAVAPPRIKSMPPASETVLPVTVEDPAGCPRYLGRVIENVDLSRPTPLWMRERLRRSGLRCIDPAVDVTNYVLLELGQPMHAFDRDQLEAGIVVRTATTDDTLTLLDGRELRFADAAAAGAPPLLITDAGGPVALAGVMGGTRSGVTASTRNLFLECAFFAPSAVAAAARRYALRTDAAHRYERGVDFALPFDAMERATQLLLDIAGGRAGPVTNATSKAHLPRRAPLRLRKARLDALVGEEVPASNVRSILHRLELEPKGWREGDEPAWTVTPPSHRFDLAIEEDLVEEVLRVHGYNAVASRLPSAPLPPGRVPAEQVAQERLADLLVDLGYAEAVTYSFVAAERMRALAPGATPLAVRNPVSRDHAVMRTNLLPGLLDALGNNMARQARRVRLFEIGQCFPGEPETANTDADAPAGGHAAPPPQRVLCGGVLFGARDEHSWAHDGAATDFFDAKGDVQRLLALGGGDVTFAPAADPVLHPGQAAAVCIGTDRIGRVGRLHPRLEAALALPAGVFVFELRLDAALALRPRRHGVVSRQPAVRRDLALVLARDVPAARLERVARGALGDVLTRFELFDLYTGEGVAEGEKSVAVGLTLQHPSRTLAAADIDGLLRGVLDAYANELSARLR